METVFFILFAIPLVLWGLGGVEGGKIEKNAEGHFLVALGVSVSLSILGSSDYILIV